MPAAPRRLLVVLVLLALAATGCATVTRPAESTSGLANVLPRSFRGMELEDMNGYFAPLEPVIAAAGGTMREAEILGRVGDDGATSVIGVRVPGVSGEALADAFIADSRVAIEREGLGPMEVDEVTLAGKPVSRIVVPEMTLYVLATADTLYYATAVDEAAATELLGLLG